MSAVSIVIPAFNHARFLPQAIESVLGQTHPGVELIVLDDGSTDDTRAVLARYGERFRWETQPNMGQAATLNKGWRQARGELLGYLSADDYLHRDAVRRAVETLRQDDGLAMVYPDFEQVDEDSRRRATVRTREFRYEDMLLRLVCPPGPGALFRRSAWQIAGDWDPSLRQIPDLAYWLRLGLVGRFRRIPEVLAYYRVHAGAQSFSRVNAARADEFIRVVGALLDDARAPAAIRSQGARARANALLHSARLHLLSGRTGTAARRLLEAMRTDPLTALRPRSYRLLAGGMMWRLRTAAQ